MSNGPRDRIASALEALGRPRAQALAAFLRGKEDDGAIPCWGAISEHLTSSLERDEDWLALWEVVTEVGDRRALLVFIHAARRRPAVMARVLGDAAALPAETQRALVTFGEVAAEVPSKLSSLGVRAKQLWESGPEAIAIERRVVGLELSRLLSSRWFVPTRRDPAIEPPDMRDTEVNR